ncbi:MAG: undecaprenyl-diphosphatase UppP, partial [Candidatus Nomurabacteria bacterium]|nr:undecaprenyl-diphosphatase UppP [Candidatus Nomurabacteria bacterium]
MTIIQSIIFGIVEGITEFLPISSTAHLDITRLLLGIPATSFVKSFEIAIQLGAILAVVLLYRKNIFTSWKYFRNICIAFIPTGIIGFVLYKLIKSFLLGNTLLIACMLILGGVVIILFEKKYQNKVDENDVRTIESLTIKELLIMGTAQTLAVVPGVSRSLSVIISGRMMGISRTLVTEFSFLLAIPTMLTATVYDLYKSGFAFTKGDWGALSVGFVVSFIVAFFVVKWLIQYIQKNSFIIFGWYRILLGIFILLFL